MGDYTWDQSFIKLFGKCLDLYRDGNTDYKSYYTPQEYAYLKTIGYSPIEFFDFVEDFAKYGEPTISTAVLIASVRRDYLNVIMRGEYTDKEIKTDTLPAKDNDINNIQWLPRLIAKARIKLRGEMASDLMYCCGGDRKFFKHFNLHPADFLRLAWAAGDKDEQIINFVISRAKLIGIKEEYKI